MKTLARMDAHEELAQRYDAVLAMDSDQRSEDDRIMLTVYPTAYRRSVGVHPTGRHELRRRLKTVAEYGVGNIERITSDVNKMIYEKIVSGPGESSPFS